MKTACLSIAGWLLISTTTFALAADQPAMQRRDDVIYGRKHGVVLTMNVFSPAKDANGAGVVWVVSGGWVSAHEIARPEFPFSPVNELVSRGYTVFAVVHGSQPKYTIPEILQDMHRAVRYIRVHAADYGIDAQRIGITGGSAGGHLSLMQGTAGAAGDMNAKDPVDQASSRVQAVACFFPPTDFLNYGKPGEDAIGRGVLKDFSAPFQFSELDTKRGRFGGFVPVTDEEKIKEIGRQISPINHVSSDDPPTLIIHGDKDLLVPYQQAEIFIAKLKESGVPAELVTKPGAAHGWANIGADMPTIAGWFDKHLAKPAGGRESR
ncbi:MAG: alpha/beta hydrolase [Planctomycetes bacterium]|nr:alpha/beta hydrolase [Planctomycetota bacterium]